ncbi:MAG: glycosyltransferase family 39 protein, partial [Polyangiales bacterium]
MLIAYFGTDAGITIDEPNHVAYGDHVLDWYGGSFGDPRVIPEGKLHLYGGLFDAPAQWLTRHSPVGVYETRHVLSALVAALGLVATWRIGALFGGPRAGFCAAALLLFTPAWLGHGLFNPKDIPFGTAATFAVWTCLRVLTSPYGLSWRLVLLSGTAIGIAVGVRPGGLFLLGYLGLAVGAHTLLAWRSGRRRPALAPITWRLFVVGLVVWAWMLVAWPWAQLSPLLRPLEAATAAGRYAYNPLVLFQGVLIPARELP